MHTRVVIEQVTAQRGHKPSRLVRQSCGDHPFRQIRRITQPSGDPSNTHPLVRRHNRIQFVDTRCGMRCNPKSTAMTSFPHGPCHTGPGAGAALDRGRRSRDCHTSTEPADFINGVAFGVDAGSVTGLL